MDHTKRMALVPHELISNLHAKQEQLNDDPLLSSLVGLDADMQHIIHSNQPTDIKLKLYQQALQRYLFFKEQQREPYKIEVKSEAAPSSVGKPNILRSLMDIIPKKVLPKAKLLLKHIEDNPEAVGWNERNELLVNGQRVLNSNIIDLINDFSLARAKSEPPEGFAEFAQALQETNVPREAISNQARWKAILPGTSHAADEAEFDPITPSKATPRKRSKRKQKALDTMKGWQRGDDG